MDPFEGAITDPQALRTLYDAPLERALLKDVGVLDEMCRRLVRGSAMVFIGTVDADGRADVSPRGGPPGFVTVLDEHHLAIPDATGNNRLDTLSNIVATGRAGALHHPRPRHDTARRRSRCGQRAPRSARPPERGRQAAARRDRDRRRGGLHPLSEGVHPLSPLGPLQLAGPGLAAERRGGHPRAPP